jgi:hypothetical protein
MKHSPSTHGKSDQRHSPASFFRYFIFVGVILIFGLIAPFVLGKYCGHTWGLFAAIGDICAWFYLNKKYGGKNRLSLSTRMVWLMGFAYIVFAVVYEFMHL